MNDRVKGPHFLVHGRVPLSQLQKVVRLQAEADDARNADEFDAEERGRQAACLEHLADLYAHHVYVPARPVDYERLVRPVRPFVADSMGYGSPAAQCADGLAAVAPKTRRGNG